MSTYRTINERRATDPSLQNLRFNRRMSDGGWHGDFTDDDAPTGAAVVWGLACAVVMVAVLVAVFA